MTVIKTSDNVDELKAVKEKVDLDIARQRSRDTGGNDGNANNHLKKVKIHLLYHSLEYFLNFFFLFIRHCDQAAVKQSSLPKINV